MAPSTRPEATLQCRIDTLGLPVMVLADALHLLKSHSLHHIPSAV